MSVAAIEAGTIRLEGVSKRYTLGRQSSLLQGLRRAPVTDHWGLHPSDLEIARGEAVGVLGHNGAGKTTLLRLLAGVTQPTTGHLVVQGQVAPLISVGVGFHQELSGRENVLLNGQLLGLGRAHLQDQLPSIVAFSGIDEDVLDTPVKFYSNGMLLRLAFSVLVHLDADLMLVDEILAVGDASFQAKCIEQLRTMWSRGTTVLLVSHSPHVIRALCSRAIVLHHGRIAFDGPVEQAIWAYQDMLGQNEDGAGGVAVAELVTTALTTATGEAASALELGDSYRLQHRVRFAAAVDSPQVYFNVFDDTGELVYQCLTTVGQPYATYAAGDEVDVAIAFTAGMGAGRYRLATEVRSLDGRTVLNRGDGVVTVDRRGDGPALGSAELAASIVADGQPAT